MHELSICEAIADIVRANSGGRAVFSVQIRIGFLRQVVPEALDLGWTAITADTPLAGATLNIEHVPAEVECRECQVRSVLDQPFPRCPACGGLAVAVVAGDELLVTSIDVADSPAPVKE
jgi:hydrogenase nickel incorporation protein HypA/HybF